jgi:hypothetical protein
MNEDEEKLENTSPDTEIIFLASAIGLGIKTGFFTIAKWILAIFAFILVLGIATIGSFIVSGLKGKD